VPDLAFQRHRTGRQAVLKSVILYGLPLIKDRAGTRRYAMKRAINLADPAKVRALLGAVRDAGPEGGAPASTARPMRIPRF
jgi:hypothetical protein